MVQVVDAGVEPARVGRLEKTELLPIQMMGELVQQGVALIRDREASLELQTHRSQLKWLVTGLHLSHGRNKKWTEKPI